MGVQDPVTRKYGRPFPRRGTPVGNSPAGLLNDSERVLAVALQMKCTNSNLNSFHCFLLIISSTGELQCVSCDRNKDIQAAPIRRLQQRTGKSKFRFGTIGYGVDLPRAVWAKVKQVFSCQDQDLAALLPNRPRAKEVKAASQQKKTFLNKNPVDVLLIDEGNGKLRDSWVEWVQHSTEGNLPKVVVTCGPTSWLTNSKEADSRKRRRKIMSRRGYRHQEWYMEGALQGGALDQERIIDLFTRTTSQLPMPKAPADQLLPPRPMRNLLLPCGIPRRDWAPKNVLIQPVSATDCVSTNVKIDALLQGRPVYNPEGCMPDRVGSWINTEKGIRRLQPDELGKAMGVPSEWKTRERKFKVSNVEGVTDIHIWTAICDTLSVWLTTNDENDQSIPLRERRALHEEVDRKPMGAVRRAADIGELERPSSPTSVLEAEMEWNYELPDLSEGSDFYNDRVENLKRVIAGREDEAELLQEGLEALKIHRENYTEAGPKYLQVLWWEFPPEHREAVRIGSSTYAILG